MRYFWSNRRKDSKIRRKAAPFGRVLFLIDLSSVTLFFKVQQLGHDGAAVLRKTIPLARNAPHRGQRAGRSRRNTGLPCSSAKPLVHHMLKLLRN
jgi:hypothetical protein